ncbi:T9SS type A sorting domain-containing protein [Hymenobacter negativus]|uniref:T9SS type A sorting domain-containing protein n=1 Tax=Hymenobacter negativus TaxID=2795026 RepID=A0ABS0Q6J9_9BACT|nr:T9SS type A sorting domain-containing protein [Hymenobacter negativus]MBH8558286.1 T9SS type A sorting domain-containing protein [Hymenobacter negativus]
MKHFLLSVLLFVGLGAWAQPTAWTYALPAPAGVAAVAADAAGNAYVTGSFVGGSTQLGGTTISSSLPGRCLYIAKLSPQGQVLRVTKLEGAEEGSNTTGIAVDDDGNTYVSGRLHGTITYTGGQTVGAIDENFGYTVMLVKCGANGRVRWVKQAHGSQGGAYGASHGMGVAVDRAGNSYISGDVTGGYVVADALYLGSHRRDGILASYDRNGQVRWARALTSIRGSSGSSFALGVAVDNAGHCYLSGHSGGGWRLDGVTVTNAVESDYLALFDSGTGQVQWGRNVPSNTWGGALAIDRRGDACIGGDFVGTADFGNGLTLTSTTPTGYVARYDATGDIDWATAVNTSVKGVAVDQQSRKVFVTGSAGPQSYLTRLNANGRVQWQELVGGPGTSGGSGIAIDDENNVYTTGSFTGSCHFGALARSNAATQGYLARYGSHQPGRSGSHDNDFRTTTLNLFPNPAQNQLILRLDGQAEAGQATLYDHQGTPVASRTIQPAAADVHFDTSALPDGLYVLRVAAQGKTTTQQVTVQH